MKQPSSPFRGVDLPPTDQTARTLLDQAKSRGWEIPKGLREEQIVKLIRGESKMLLGETNRMSIQKLNEHAIALDNLRKSVADNIHQAIEDPSTFGINDYEWRRCQIKTLSDLATVFTNGYSSPVFELPTGGGKSHALGAVTRSFLEAAKKQKIDIHKNVKIITLTSRTNLVRQLSASGESDKEAESAEDEGSALRIGDLRQWVSNLLTEEEIQIITANSDATERKKDAVLSVLTYQGLSRRSLNKLVSARKLLMFILDESHNITERVRHVLLECAPGAFFFGGSATPFGPKRNPFTLFEEIEDGPAQHRKNPWEQKLASHQSIIELIGNRELKQPRFMKAETDISLADVRSTGGIINEKDLGKVLARNLPLLKRLLQRLYTEDHPVLAATCRPQLRDRITIAFVNSVDIAKKIAEYVDKDLGIPSTVLSGEDSIEVFEKKQEDLRQGKIRFAATVRKGTEGLDVQAADAAILLQPHGPNSEWLRRQEIGRVLRLNVKDLDSDALIIDAVYKDEPGTVSTLSLFDEHQYIDGGLIAAGPLRDVERIIISLLQKGKTIDEAINTLREPQKSLAIKLFKREKRVEFPPPPLPPKSDEDDKYNLKKVKLVEDPNAVDVLKSHDKELLLHKTKEALAEHGINSRTTLMNMGIVAFQKTRFKHFGTGSALFKIVVRVIQGKPDMTHVAELADALGWTENREEELEKARGELAKHGIISRDTLMAIGIKEFKEMNFGDFGGSKMFFSKIVRPLDLPNLVSSHISELADALGWTENREEELEKARGELAKHGIISRDTLMKTGLKSFIEMDFGDFGKGQSFFVKVVRKVDKRITLAQLQELADVMGWIEDEQDILELANIALNQEGFSSRESLLNISVKKFSVKLFTGFGTGRALFIKVVRPLSEENMLIAHLCELADTMGWTKEKMIENACIALAEHGITSGEELMNMNPSKFTSMDFGDFGKGQAFFSKIVGMIESGIFKKQHLQELATALGWVWAVESIDEKIERAKKVLANLNVRSREDLNGINTNKFTDMSFGDFGGGKAFLSSLLPHTAGGGSKVLRSQLDELADAMGW